uniref:Uncharacterized protein n=1 Tax=Vitis vinifera TaxID=29760 RepID=F6I1C0_VITVI
MSLKNPSLNPRIRLLIEKRGEEIWLGKGGYPERS